MREAAARAVAAPPLAQLVDWAEGWGGEDSVKALQGIEGSQHSDQADQGGGFALLQALNGHSADPCFFRNPLLTQVALEPDCSQSIAKLFESDRVAAVIGYAHTAPRLAH